MANSHLALPSNFSSSALHRSLKLCHLARGLLARLTILESAIAAYYSIGNIKCRMCYRRENKVGDVNYSGKYQLQVKT